MHRTSIFFLTALPLSSSVIPQSAFAAPPNILFIAIDDLNDCTGFLGGQPQALTPNMDRLAKKQTKGRKEGTEQ